MKDEKVPREMLEETNEEMEDAEYLRKIMERIAQGKERTYSHEEVWADLDDVSESK